MLNASDGQCTMLRHLERQRSAPLRQRRVLIVEDEALVAMLAEDVLRDAGAEIVGVAGSVAEALYLIEAAVRDGGLDAAVLDINLAGDPVTPVADRLAALGVPFLFATGYGDDHDMGRHAAAPVVRKPFALATLAAAVDGLAGPRTGGEAGR